MQTIGILFHPKIPKTTDIARELSLRLAEQAVGSWIASAWDEAEIRARLVGTQMLITLGGDGTILRTARLSAGSDVPIAGVNFGRVGFLAEYQPEQLLSCVDDLVNGQFWLMRPLALRYHVCTDAAPHAIRSFCASTSTL